MYVYMYRYLGAHKNQMCSAVVGPENRNLSAENGWTVYSSNLK